MADVHGLDTPDARKLLETEIVDAHIATATRWVIDQYVEQFHNTLLCHLTVYPRRIDNLESPAEAVFEVWALARQYGVEGNFHYKRQVSVKGASGAKYRADFQMTYISSYRFDSPDEIVLPVLIEVDGHEFHERTRQQVERRNTRDRDLAAAGFTLLHFSYSELTQHPLKCFEEVEDAGWKAFHIRRQEPR